MVLKKYELEAKLKDENQLIQSGVLREENPLDLSDEFKKFLEACRRGDLRTCQELISLGVNINGKDKFDYTPLIVASLCGHFELVQLLLESGALAERNTFQGERCIYNALNDKIRNLLLQYDYSKSTDPLQPWASHITALLTRTTPKTADITLTTNTGSFDLHKFYLSSRTPYFQKKLSSAPETDNWHLSHSVPVESFQAVLRYLYLADLPRELVDAASDVTEEDVFKGIDKISRQLEVEKLWDAFLSGDRRLARQRFQDEVQRAQSQVEDFFRNNVLKHKMVVEKSKVSEVKWPYDNSIFADCLLYADEYEEEEEEEGEGEDNETGVNRSRANSIPVGPGGEVTTTNGVSRPSLSVIYPVHRAMLIRSPYFETMFSSEFREAQRSEHLHVIKLDCTPEVLEVVLTFLYTEKADCPLEFGLELLYTADMLLLDKLKNKAALTISTLGSGNSNMLVDRTHTEGETETEAINVYDVIHAAWDLRVQRLEEFAARYIAYRLEDYIDDEDFAELIRESASRLQSRQETDTIELLDDIRYYLSERFRLRFEDAGLDDMLDEEGEISAGTAEALAAQVAANSEEGKSLEDTGPPAVDGINGVVRTLDGEAAEDEFESDALNYQILLRKIDVMLDRLQLDA
ncbi:uncharacterized protein E0L32_005635 [Thyridium curvatum]|uniref:BTB domain-containing protein n=1 Tax=Thyridium curvatum TaxID=1093900 RepID=A0A507AT03_9PEZI|nr:uncharacterized protein E0L32_005635 [Thyridium curvatum]TPX13935.1 hypothetical protein E0L32_005635 [Thyridium curvatum]